MQGFYYKQAYIIQYIVCMYCMHNVVSCFSRTRNITFSIFNFIRSIMSVIDIYARGKYLKHGVSDRQKFWPFSVPRKTTIFTCRLYRMRDFRGSEYRWRERLCVSVRSPYWHTSARFSVYSHCADHTTFHTSLSVFDFV